MPKYGDNFDKKYCEAPDKLGVDTKERYEKYIRDENFKIVFNNFTFINEPEETERNININKPGTHKPKSKSIDLNPYSSSSYYGQAASHNSKYTPYKIKEKKLSSIIYDNKYSLVKSNTKYPVNVNMQDKINLKKIVNSNSTNTLFKNYKQSTNSANSTGSSVTNSLNFLSKKSGSTTNFNY